MEKLTKSLDAYAQTFGKSDRDEFISEVKDLIENSEWIPAIQSKCIRAKGMMPIEAPILSSTYHIPPEIVSDTGNGTKLLTEVRGAPYCVRDTALQSLEDTAKVSGLALSRVEADSLATILNLCLDAARGNSLILNRFGKASAFLSDSSYVIMRQDDLLAALEAALENQFGSFEFLGGYIDHGFSQCSYALEEMHDEIVKPYIDALSTYSKANGDDIMPCVEFRTSDVGWCAATIQPYFRLPDGAKLCFCPPIKVEHKHSSGNKPEGLELFTEQAHEIFGRFKESANKIQVMDSIEVKHPRNALINICKRLNLPKKYGGKAEDLINKELGNSSCTFYDLYLYISRIIAFAKEDGKNERDLWRLSEVVARVISMNVHDYDYPGSISW